MWLPSHLQHSDVLLPAPVGGSLEDSGIDKPFQAEYSSEENICEFLWASFYVVFFFPTQIISCLGSDLILIGVSMRTDVRKKLPNVLLQKPWSP